MKHAKKRSKVGHASDQGDAFGEDEGCPPTP